MRIYMDYVALSVMLVLIGCRGEPPNNKVANQTSAHQVSINQAPANQAPAVAAQQSPSEATAPGNPAVSTDAAVPADAVPADAVASASVPEGFPREIPLREAEVFLLKQTTSGQGCGSMKWDNQECGMYLNDYNGKILTPWVAKPVSLSSIYAQVYNRDVKRDVNARSPTFLVKLSLDGQVYYRDTPQQANLVWKPTTDR